MSQARALPAVVQEHHLGGVRAPADGADAPAGSPPPLTQATLEADVRTTDIAEAATWIRGVERTAPRQLRFTGPGPLAIFRSFCASILLTRTIAETV